ncbi:hypothetical protein ACQEVZ_27495 [Dactylosporangium sp. CA-152071]|uniref:hypothetical protein n=1 Tax=Dactylosporangium sp. CA-152071 TaxID=3239933 RepID=UPI003D8D1525
MNLHDRLDDLAGEMAGTDLAGLRQRVDRASRRLRMRRTLAASAAGVAVAVALTGGAALLKVRHEDTRPDVVPAVSATPSRSPSLPSSAPSSSPSSAPPSPAAAIPGALSFLTLKAGKAIELHRYAGGTLQTVNFGTATGEDMYATPSPDGTRLAINTSPDRDRIAPGDLVVATSGGARHVVAKNVRWDGGNTVVWTPDGSALVAGGVRYDVATGAAHPLPDRPQYLAYSPSGVTTAYLFQGNDLKVSTEGAGATRTVPVTGLDECERTAGCPTSVQAVSDSGLLVALGNVNSDPSHVYRTVVVYNTVKRMRLQLGAFEHVWFRPDGGLVVVTATEVKVLDQALKVTHTYPLPAHDPAAVMFYRA